MRDLLDQNPLGEWPKIEEKIPLLSTVAEHVLAFQLQQQALSAFFCFHDDHY